MTTVVERPADLLAHVGRELGASPWVSLGQADIDAFARLTGDDHWIHVDTQRAARELPGGKTLVHGFLALAMIPRLQREVFRIEQRGKGLNYGCNRIRFTSPLPRDARVRLRQTLKACELVQDGIRITLDCTMDIDGQDRPALVAETMVQIFNP